MAMSGPKMISIWITSPNDGGRTTGVVLRGLFLLFYTSPGSKIASAGAESS
jgi:hypothetical protein